MQETGFSELNNTAGTEPVPSGRRLPCNTRKRRAGCSSRPGDRAEVNMSSKRKDYISWDEYFMGVAQLAGMRSKDPNTQVGSCIVSSDHKILSMGYNGLPKGCDDDVFPWDRDGADQLMTKYPYVTCNECAKAIIQAGIKNVVYDSDKYADSEATIASKRMFNAAGVRYYQYQRTGRKIELNV